MRTIPEAPEALCGADTGNATLSLEIKVVTPLFGGGAEAGVNDPVTPIRGSSIRGHLRFWWRATRGANCESVKDLRKKEGEIWGTTEEPSKVSLVVSNTRGHGKRQHTDDYGFDRYGPEAYVLFSAKQNKNVLAKEGIRFILELDYPKNLENEIKPALWAWLNFGGIGARTRRGCGALFSHDFAPRLEDGQLSWDTSYFPENVVKRDWPTLPPGNQLLWKTPSGDHLSAWK